MHGLVADLEREPGALAPGNPCSRGSRVRGEPVVRKSVSASTHVDLPFQRPHKAITGELIMGTSRATAAAPRSRATWLGIVKAYRQSGLSARAFAQRRSGL